MNARTWFAVVSVSAAALTISSGSGHAHKPITSPYTFAEDVAPILKEHCSSCHVTGGIAPMSLGAYEEAVPWAESMRVELVAGHMPPWGIEAGASGITNANILTARELNVLLTWASGGTPPGASPSTAEKPATLSRSWRLGEPDLTLRPSNEFVMPAEIQERVEEFTVDTGLTETRWLRAVDVLPGDPTVVRNATVSLTPDASVGPADEKILALWVAGDTPVAAADGTGFMLPAGARLQVRVHYKKTWQRERDVIRDRSAVGLYFARPGAATMKVTTLDAERDLRINALERERNAQRQLPGERPGAVTDVRWLADTSWPWTTVELSSPPSATIQEPSDASTLSFGRTIGKAYLKVHAIYADPRLQGVSIRANVIRENGSRDSLIVFRPRPGWTRRYWLRDAISLLPGDRIEVLATRDDEALLPPGAIRTAPTDLTNVGLAFDVTDTAAPVN